MIQSRRSSTIVTKSRNIQQRQKAGKSSLNVPAFCDDCGAPSTLDHFLINMKSGLIVQRHNEIRDAIGDLVAMVCGQVSSAFLCKNR